MDFLKIRHILLTILVLLVPRVVKGNIIIYDETDPFRISEYWATEFDLQMGREKSATKEIDKGGVHYYDKFSGNDIDGDDSLVKKGRAEAHESEFKDNDIPPLRRHRNF